jgi:hypothetical protein
MREMHLSSAKPPETAALPSALKPARWVVNGKEAYLRDFRGSGLHPNGWLGSDLLGKPKRQSRTGGEPPLAGDIRLEHQVGRPARPTSLLTPRWSKRDSKSRSHPERNAAESAPVAIGPLARGPELNTGPCRLFRDLPSATPGRPFRKTRDRRFESAILQRALQEHAAGRRRACRL